MAADDYKTVVTRVNVPRQRRIRIVAASAVLVFAVGVYFLGYQHGFDDRRWVITRWRQNMQAFQCLKP